MQQSGRVSLPKSMAFLYTITTNTEKELVDTVSFTITSKKIPYLGINITKEGKDLYMKTLNL